jgi:hypothetical protein
MIGTTAALLAVQLHVAGGEPDLMSVGVLILPSLLLIVGLALWSRRR